MGDRKIFGNVLRGDKTIWGLFFAMCLVSIVCIYTATSQAGNRSGNYNYELLRQIKLLGIGFFLIVVMQRIKMGAKTLTMGLFFTLILIVLLMVWTAFKSGTINGTNRWYSIMGLSFQPSEFGKLILVCVLAILFSMINKKNEQKIFYRSLVVSVLIIGFIVFDNLSTAILLSFVAFILFILSDFSIKKKLILFLSILFLGLFAYSVLYFTPAEILSKVSKRAPTWKARIDRHSKNYKTLSADTYKIEDYNRQETHAKIAIARAGLIGVPGTSLQRDLLSNADSDYIFSIIIEELGLFGAVFVIGLYVMFLFRCGTLASRTNRKDYRFLILGCALMITMQALINMLVAVDIIPVTGLPLPLISKGGTSLLVTCIYFGIILTCSSKLNQGKTSKSKPIIKGSNEGNIELIADHGIASQN